MKIILTGATGMVGEGVLLECLQNPQVEAVLSIGRKLGGRSHEKLQELIVPDFMEIGQFAEKLKGYDGCFFCAGISSIGLSEEKYRQITYDVTLQVAKVLSVVNPDMVFTYVSGAYTDSSESGSTMWARVKGKTENDLMKLPFRGEYNFRPGFMKPVDGQKNVRWFFRPVIWVVPVLFPKASLMLNQVGKAMINAVSKGYEKQVLEIEDIKKLSAV